jgi:hypothetical protein
VLTVGVTWWMIEGRNEDTKAVNYSHNISIQKNDQPTQQKTKGEIVVTKERDKSKVQPDGNEETNQQATKAYISKNVTSFNEGTKANSTASTKDNLPGRIEIVKIGRRQDLDRLPLTDANKGNSDVLNSKKEIAIDMPFHKYYHSNKELQLDSTQTSLATPTQTSNHPDTLKDGYTKARTHKSNRWHVGFTIYAGSSGNSTGINLISAKSVSADASYLSSPSTSGALASVPQLTYKHNASYGAGFFVTKPINKRTSISVGLDYHFFSTRSSVGRRIDVAVTGFDTVLNKDFDQNHYYTGGQTTSYINKYQTIQVPIDLRFTLNKSVDKPVMFSVGLSPAFLIGSRALYLNKSQRIYYEEKKQFKAFMLFGQSALMFTPVNTNKFQLGIGPTLQYGFNSFSKWQTHTNQHLLFTGIKSNITLK